MIFPSPGQQKHISKILFNDFSTPWLIAKFDLYLPHGLNSAATPRFAQQERMIKQL